MKWILVGVIVACNTLGDLLNTMGMRRYGEVEDFAPRGIGRMIRSIARNPFVVGGVSCMAVSFFALMALLSVANLSFAVPATAGSYLVETLLAKLVLKEDVRWRRWAGVSLVASGVVLLALY